MAMATSAAAVSQQVLNKLRSSNLNFLVSETPYSAQIFLQKRFVKEASGPDWAIEDQNKNAVNIGDHHMEIVNNLEKTHKSLSETNKLLENKLAKTEGSAYKAFTEKADEIAVWKNTVNTSKIEMDTLRKELTKEK